MVGKTVDRPDRQRPDADRCALGLLPLIAFGIFEMILPDHPCAVWLPVGFANGSPHGLEATDMRLGFLHGHGRVVVEVKIDAVATVLLRGDRRHGAIDLTHLDWYW